MLQRIQTVYILIVVILLILAFFFPLATFINNAEVYQLGSFGISPENDSFSSRFPFYAGLFMAIGVALVAIGSFKNRKRQLLLGKINYLLLLITLVMVFLDIDYVGKSVLPAGVLPIYGLSTYFIISCLPLIFLANRAIKKDEALVNSLDRLR